jgi:hypothetical protein
LEAMANVLSCLIKKEDAMAVWVFGGLLWRQKYHCLSISQHHVQVVQPLGKASFTSKLRMSPSAASIFTGTSIFTTLGDWCLGYLQSRTK